MSDRAAGHIHILLHTLRRDGFMYLEAAGNWGTVLSKPITLFSPRLTVNAAAPQGEGPVPTDYAREQTYPRVHIR
jgi:hypothetical protein